MADKYYPGTKNIVDAVFQLMGLNQDSERYKKLILRLKDNTPHDIPSQDYAGPF